MELSHKDYSAIDAVHADTPNRRPRTAFIPGSATASTARQTVTTTPAGQRAMGRGMWQKYREMCRDELAEYATE